MANPFVKLTNGVFKGGMGRTIGGKPFLSFKGIPFAEVPTGPLRFKAPRPPTALAFKREAINQANQCLGIERAVKKKNGLNKIDYCITGSEDCLYLNVFAPSSSKPKPVIVFIHKGGFISDGIKQYKGEVLLDEDVILVCIPYRTGCFGFLSFDDPELGVSGNAGLKDIVRGLEWVKENIENFNGDPNNVTLYGHTSGGAAIIDIMQSPKTKGLFHKAIVQSGSPLIYGYKGNKRSAHNLARSLGCQSTNDKEVLKFLQETTSFELYNGQLSMEHVPYASYLQHFAPVVENPDSKDALLTEEPIDTISSGRYNHVPTIFGYNSNDGGYFNVLGTNYYDQLVDKNVVPHWLQLAIGTEEHKRFARKIRDFYQKECPLKLDGTDLLSVSGRKLLGDICYIRGLIQNAKLFAKTSTKPVYMYRYSGPSTKLSEYYIPGREDEAFNEEELGYPFRLTDHRVESGSIEDINRRRFVKMFTNFAKTSNPISAGTKEILPSKWEPLDHDNLKVLDINQDASIKQLPEIERMKFWDEIYQSFEHSKHY